MAHNQYDDWYETYAPRDISRGACAMETYGCRDLKVPSKEFHQRPRRTAKVVGMIENGVKLPK